MASALSFIFGVIAEVHERVVTLARFHDDVAAASAIAAGRTSARNKLLAPERDAPIAAVPGFYSNLRFIDKHE
jgi:hypothetical protein